MLNHTQADFPVYMYIDSITYRVFNLCIDSIMYMLYFVSLQEVTANIRGHHFVETTYHTPSNCDVCNKTLPWSINIIRKGEGSYECKREFTRTFCKCVTHYSSHWAYACCHARMLQHDSAMIRVHLATTNLHMKRNTDMTVYVLYMYMYNRLQSSTSNCNGLCSLHQGLA